MWRFMNTSYNVIQLIKRKRFKTYCQDQSYVSLLHPFPSTLSTYTFFWRGCRGRIKNFDFSIKHLDSSGFHHLVIINILFYQASFINIARPLSSYHFTQYRHLNLPMLSSNHNVYVLSWWGYSFLPLMMIAN